MEFAASLLWQQTSVDDVAGDMSAKGYSHQGKRQMIAATETEA